MLLHVLLVHFHCDVMLPGVTILRFYLSILHLMDMHWFTNWPRTRKAKIYQRKRQSTPDG